LYVQLLKKGVTFASKAKGVAELMSNEQYYNSMNQADLD